jgi:exodeoxyribonuclease VII small subunit
MAKAAPVPKSFESAVTELESIVRSMEAGELSLEQALEHYQRGVGLLKFCQQTLESADERIRMLEGERLVPLASGAPGTPE